MLPPTLPYFNTYLLLLGFFVGPKAIFALCSFLGSCLMRLTGWPRINLGHYIGILLGCGGVLAYIYGLTVGVRQVKVNHLTLQFDDLPAAFDGYKILHISDLHLGTFYGWRQKILQAEMDSIARQHADLMVFTGDVQNIRPKEIFPHTDLLRSTTQGMVSVLGNHDYASYAKDTHEAQDRLLRLLVETEQNAWDGGCCAMTISSSDAVATLSSWQARRTTANHPSPTLPTRGSPLRACGQGHLW